MSKVAKSVRVENGYPHRTHRSPRIKNYTESRKVRVKWKKQQEKIRTRELDTELLLNQDF